jgi:hypothetical protein
VLFDFIGTCITYSYLRDVCFNEWPVRALEFTETDGVCELEVFGGMKGEGRREGVFNGEGWNGGGWGTFIVICM